MGLDMYLTADKYVSGWKHNSEDERTTYKQIKEAIGLGDFDVINSPHLIAKVNVAYWRKANQIHQWFVKNIQDGNDDCGYYYVSRKKLRELVSICQKLITKLKLGPGKIHTGTSYSKGETTETYEDGLVVTNTELAEELLPSQGGFFFGSTEYDQGYVDDLKNTIEQIEPLLSDARFADFDFYYHSSW